MIQQSHSWTYIQKNYKKIHAPQYSYRSTIYNNQDIETT